MATEKQLSAAKNNIKKAQAAWKGMTRRQHSLAQPQGRARKRPGAGGGKFYRIQVRPKGEFVTFRTQDVGEPGHLERLAGKRSSGSWDTQAWLVAKEDAHVQGGTLIIDHAGTKTALKQIPGPIVHVKGDLFTAPPRRNVPESEKPTAAQKKARSKNIKKAQAARRRQPGQQRSHE